MKHTATYEPGSKVTSVVDDSPGGAKAAPAKVIACSPSSSGRLRISSVGWSGLFLRNAMNSCISSVASLVNSTATVPLGRVAGTPSNA